MTIDKRGKKYRVRYMYNGKQRSFTLDYKPGIKEAEQLIEEDKLKHKEADKRGETFQELAKKYIESKRGVLSPNTVRGYYNCLDRLSERFLDLDIAVIDQCDIQTEISSLTASHSPKSVKNTYSFISSVIKMFIPGFYASIKLPQAKAPDLYTPTEEDIKRILELAKPTRYYVPYCLGIMGMRRGEIAAATMDDIKGNVLTISKSTYIDDSGLHGIKDTAKTETSNRRLYLPDELIKRINAQGYIYNGAESRLWASLNDFQEALNIPHFRFHDLRVYFATYAHLHNIPDKVIQDTAGWKSDYTMKKIYRRTQEQVNFEYQKDLLNTLT